MKRYEEAMLTGAAFLLAGTAGLAGINHSVYQKLSQMDNGANTQAVSTQIDQVEPISASLKMEDSGKTDEVLVIKEYKHFSIPYESVTYDVGSMEGGTRQVKTPGENGERVEEYEITFKDGQETGRVLLSQEVIKEPVTEIIYESAEVDATDLSVTAAQKSLVSSLLPLYLSL